MREESNTRGSVLDCDYEIGPHPGFLAAALPCSFLSESRSAWFILRTVPTLLLFLWKERSKDTQMLPQPTDPDGCAHRHAASVGADGRCFGWVGAYPH